MKSGWLGCAILFLANVVPGCAQTSAPAKALSSLEQSLIASEKSLIVAMKKDDGAFFKRTVSQHFSFVGVDGTLHEGQDAVGELGDSDLTELTPYEMKVVAAGENVAIVTYDAIVRRAPEEGRRPAAAVSAFQLGVGEARGRRVEAEVSSDDGGALGRLVGTAAFGLRLLGFARFRLFA